MSLNKDENAMNRVVRNHLKEEELGLLTAYKRSLGNVQADLSTHYKKHNIGGILPQKRVHKARRLKALGANIQREIGKLEGTQIMFVRNTAEEVYKHSYYRTAHALESEIGVSLGFAQLNPAIVEAAVANDFSLIKWTDSVKQNNTQLQQKVRGIVTAGVIQGTPLDAVARELKTAVGISAGKAIRIIRTETLRAQSEAQLSSYNQAEGVLGFPLERIWLSTLDGRTRISHQAMDQQTADAETKLFTLPRGEVTRGPRLSGIAEEDIFCRCRVISRIPEGHESELRAARDKDGTSINVKNMAYDEWAVARHIKAKQRTRVICTSECRPIGMGKEFPNLKAYETKYQGQGKSNLAVKYDYYKLRHSLGHELTSNQKAYLVKFRDKFEGTSIHVIGRIKTKPLTLPKPRVELKTPVKIQGATPVPKPTAEIRKPEIITKEIFDKAVDKGETVFYRGIKGKDAGKYADELRAGKQYVPKNDIFGSGTFVAVGDDAERMAMFFANSSGGGGVIVRGVLKKEARIITKNAALKKIDSVYNEFNVMHNKKISALIKKGKAGDKNVAKEVQKLFDEKNKVDLLYKVETLDPSKWAKREGYHGLRQYNGHSLSDEIVLLDISKTKIVKTDIITKLKDI